MERWPERRGAFKNFSNLPDLTGYDLAACKLTVTGCVPESCWVRGFDSVSYKHTFMFFTDEGLGAPLVKHRHILPIHANTQTQRVSHVRKN
jgi:hypothetical protein